MHQLVASMLHELCNIDVAYCATWFSFNLLIIKNLNVFLFCIYITPLHPHSSPSVQGLFLLLFLLLLTGSFDSCGYAIADGLTSKSGLLHVHLYPRLRMLQILHLAGVVASR